MVNENSIKKKQFVQHIIEMNTEPLKEILVKNAFKKYSNNSFLEKLNEVFTTLKSKGNTKLEVYKGVGVCSCNKNKKVFCFVGNNTKDYFTLSYQENDDNYYNFSTSCSEVSYNEKLELNEFYYFSIKPEDTLEYNNHQKYSIPIQEYKVFCSQDTCSMKGIEIWLEKHKDFYNKTVELLKKNNLNSVELLITKEFEILYGKLSILSLLHQKEAYFKEQIQTYNKIKDSVSKLKEWFAFQHENKKEYQLFSSVFYDSRALVHYALKLEELRLNPEDFKHTLKYLSIIEDSKALAFKGIIKSISYLEVYEKTNTSRAYSKRKIVLSIDDFCCSEYQISFSDERVKHLDNLSVGQFVKVYARLTGGATEKPKDIKEYKHHLYGWRIEKLDAKPKTKKKTKEMNLYYKYILPPSF